MPAKVTIAVCQTVPEVGNPEASAAQARAALRKAVDAGAGIVVLPELVNSGYVFNSGIEVRDAAVPSGGDLLAGWAQEAARGDGVVVIGGFCELGEDGRIFNSAAVVDASGVIAVYRKLHLWDEEARWFHPGDRPAPVVATRHGRIGIGICYDIEFPELTRGLALAGADLIALPTNWPLQESAGDETPMVQLIARTTACLSRVYVAVCDRGGSERGLDFQGGSIIAAPDGSALAAATPGAAPEMLLAECQPVAARDKRTSPRNDAFADRRPEHYAGELSSRSLLSRAD